ncbi:MAG: MmcQ/YjbR family DNA-binding protein [Vicinamibacterales bacterium]|jgi:predicted DNA-binding protein (MmcQ/YjbR family)|nr:MmcQ/YjbR family DNA-binding protein [Vicinamibacterales bacterium]MDP6608449.1 MmcQ/YjbR family DNA-binding protein [Vicinamibacterales bacterium]|tara:strand:- start:21406 stop:21795 length:390 start_codon:yes stop_codon:yes gene_type:complete
MGGCSGRRALRHTAYQAGLTTRHGEVQDLLRDLPGILEKPLWGGLTYRYRDRVVFVLTRRARSILLEMKLTEFEADAALRLPGVRPHSFTRLARTGWIGLSITATTPLSRVSDLVDRSYELRVESSSPI